jgi:hypothetical protein
MARAAVAAGLVEVHEPAHDPARGAVHALYRRDGGIA